MYSYNLTDEKINNMTLEELKMWKDIIAMHLYGNFGWEDYRLCLTYKAILRARDKYLSNEK